METEKELLKPLEDLPEYLQLRYMWEAYQGFESVMREDIDTSSKWANRDGIRNVGKIINEASGFEELGEVINDEIERQEKQGESEAAKSIKDFFEETAETYVQVVEDDPYEEALTHLSYEENKELAEGIEESIDLDSREGSLAYNWIQGSNRSYETARNMRSLVDGTQEDDEIDKEKIKTVFTKAYQEAKKERG